MQNVKFLGDSNIYKVITNILIENRNKRVYANIVKWGKPHT